MWPHVPLDLGGDPKASAEKRGLDSLQGPVEGDDEVQATETHARARHLVSDTVGHSNPGEVV